MFPPITWLDQANTRCILPSLKPRTHVLTPRPVTLINYNVGTIGTKLAACFEVSLSPACSPVALADCSPGIGCPAVSRK